jgi:hypothetical protein
MAEITLSKLDAALKRAYPVSEITNQLYSMTPFYAQLKKQTTTINNTGSGLVAYVPIQTSYNSSAGSIDESGVIPVGRTPKWQQLEIGVSYTYGTVEFTGQSLAAAQKNSFVDEMEVKMQGLKDAMKLSLDRQYTNGRGTGLLCLTNGAGGGASSLVTVDTPGTAYLQVGMPIVTTAAETGDDPSEDDDISEGLTEATAYTVYSIDSDTTFTLGNAAGTAAVTTEKWADNHYMFRYGACNGGGTTFTATNKEAMGLRGIVDNEAIKATSSWWGLATATTTIHGISRATYPILDATITHNSGVNAAISEKRINTLLNTIEKATGQSGENPDRIFLSSYEIRNRFFDLVSGDRRFVSDTVNLKGGYETMAFQYGNKKIPWIVSKVAIPNALFALDMRYLAVYQSGEFQWMEQTTGTMFDIKVDSSGRYHIYLATLYNFSGMGCRNFKAQGACRDISET